MKLLVVRHGAAMDKEEFAHTGESDNLRPLTDEGKAEITRVAAGLRGNVEALDVLGSSPLVRARQTAEIIADAYQMAGPQVTSSLIPGAEFEDFEDWCSGVGEKNVICVVGHEPHLGMLVTWLLTGTSTSHIRLKKGGACVVEFETRVRGGAGRLNWLLTPRQLAKTAKKTAK
jgi:phosphohistidine phosphatase